MGSKFSEDMVPVSALKASPGRVVRRVLETGRPVVRGLLDLEEGREIELDEVRKSLTLGVGDDE